MSVSAGALDWAVGLVAAVPGPQPPRHPAVFAPGRLGQFALIGQFVEQRHQPRRGVAGADGVGDEAAHRGQHHVHPAGTADRASTGADDHLAEPPACLGPGGTA